VRMQNRLDVSREVHLRGHMRRLSGETGREEQNAKGNKKQT